MVAIDHTVSSTKSRFLTFLENEFGELLSSFCCNKKLELYFIELKLILMPCCPMPQKSILLKHTHVKSDSSTKLSKSVHAVVRHMIQKTPDPSQSLVLDIDSFIDDVCSTEHC